MVSLFNPSGLNKLNETFKYINLKLFTFLLFQPVDSCSILVV